MLTTQMPSLLYEISPKAVKSPLYLYRFDSGVYMFVRGAHYGVTRKHLTGIHARHRAPCETRATCTRVLMSMNMACSLYLPMKTSHNLVADTISAKRVFPRRHWRPNPWAEISCRWSKLAGWPSAPGQAHPKPTQAMPGGRGGDKESSRPGTGGGSRNGVQPSPGVPR